jgi:hypothetical protein
LRVECFWIDLRRGKRPGLIRVVNQNYEDHRSFTFDAHVEYVKWVTAHTAYSASCDTGGELLYSSIVQIYKTEW